MATNRLYNLSLDGVFLPLCLPIVGLTYMGAPVDLPVPNKRAMVNGRARNVVGYNHRLYAELATHEIQIYGDDIAFQVVDDGISFKQDDRVRTLWFPGIIHSNFGVRVGNVTTYFNTGQWHKMRGSSPNKTLILPNGRTSVYFRFDIKWSLQMDAFLPTQK